MDAGTDGGGIFQVFSHMIFKKQEACWLNGICPTKSTDSMGFTQVIWPFNGIQAMTFWVECVSSSTACRRALDSGPPPQVARHGWTFQPFQIILRFSEVRMLSYSLYLISHIENIENDPDIMFSISWSHVREYHIVCILLQIFFDLSGYSNLCIKPLVELSAAMAPLPWAVVRVETWTQRGRCGSQEEQYLDRDIL